MYVYWEGSKQGPSGGSRSSRPEFALWGRSGVVGITGRDGLIWSEFGVGIRLALLGGGNDCSLGEEGSRKYERLNVDSQFMQASSNGQFWKRIEQEEEHF